MSGDHGQSAKVSASPGRSAHQVGTALAAALADPKRPKPLIVYVGFDFLYGAAHIPGALYFGPDGTPEDQEALRKWARTCSGQPGMRQPGITGVVLWRPRLIRLPINRGFLNTENPRLGKRQPWLPAPGEFAVLRKGTDLPVPMFFCRDPCHEVRDKFFSCGLQALLGASAAKAGARDIVMRRCGTTKVVPFRKSRPDRASHGCVRRRWDRVSVN